MATNWNGARPRGPSAGSETGPKPNGHHQSSSFDPESSAAVGRTAARGRKDSSRSRTPNIFSRSRSRSGGEDKPPSIIRRLSRSRSRRRTQSSSKSEEATKDLPNVSLPSPTPLDTANADNDASIIGLAVGSPSQLPPNYRGPLGRSNLAQMETDRHNAGDSHFQDSSNKIKAARWKKIGGLFKAKTALIHEPTPSPFYQLQVQYAAQAANQSQSSLGSRDLAAQDIAARDGDARFLFDNILGSNGQLAPQKYGDGPLKQIHEVRGSTEAPTRPLEEPSPPRPPRKDTPPAGLSLLDVKIPEVHLERYSVMFGSLLEKKESPSLLSRRDKAPKRLLTIADEVEEPAEAATGSVQHLEGCNTKSNHDNQSHLAPRAHSPYPRRATSPTPSKSPSFSLFPHLPQTAEKIVGPIPPDKQSPLRRSFTAPGRLSPMQETFNSEEIESSKLQARRLEKPAFIPSQTTSTSDPNYISPKQPVLAPTSAQSSAIEGVLLNMESQVTLKRMQGGQKPWMEQELEVAPLKPKQMASKVGSGNDDHSTADTRTKELNKSFLHEDTRAALERPRSPVWKSKDMSASLKPSKVRIDEIMGGSRELKHADGDASRAKGIPKPQTTDSEDLPDMHQQHGRPDPIPAKVVNLPPRAASKPSPGAVLPATGSNVETGPHAQKTAHPTSEAGPRFLQHPVAVNRPQRNDDAPPFKLANLQPVRLADRSAPDSQAVIDLYTQQPQQIHTTGRRKPLPTALSYTQPRPPASNQSHTPHPSAFLPANRPPLNVTNRSFPNYASPPPKFAMRPELPFNHRPQRHGPVDTAGRARPAEKEPNNILDYYLDDIEVKPLPRPSPQPSSPPPKVPNKLQKRLSSEKSKKRLSPINKPLPYPKSPPRAPQAPKTAPRSPVPISKYSADTVPTSEPLHTPTSTASPKGHRHSQSQSSALSHPAPLDPSIRSQSPAVMAARFKAAQLVKASSDAQQSPSRSSSLRSSSTPREHSAEFHFVVDAPGTYTDTRKHPLKIHTGTPTSSFYSQSNASTPVFAATISPPETPSGEGLMLNFPIYQEGTRANLPASRHRSASRGSSLSALPAGAGVDGAVDASSSARTAPPFARSASAMAATAAAGTGAWTGIESHLKRGKGEKVVEMQAGLVPTIVDPGRGNGLVGRHRSERSVNLVIESV